MTLLERLIHFIGLQAEEDDDDMTLVQLIAAIQALTTAVQNLTNVAQPVATAFIALQAGGTADFTAQGAPIAAATQAIQNAVALLAPLVPAAGVPAGQVPAPGVRA